MQSDFKVGDLVRLKKSNGVEPKGTILRIKQILGNSIYCDDGYANKPEWLELVTSEITREVEQDILDNFVVWYKDLCDSTDYQLKFIDVERYLDQKHNPLPTKEEFLKSVNLTEEEVKQIMEFKNISYKA